MKMWKKKAIFRQFKKVMFDDKYINSIVYLKQFDITDIDKMVTDIMN